MSGRELDPDGTDSYHPQHPWEQVGHPLYLHPGQRTRLNWPPEPARPAGPHEARTWDQLPDSGKPAPAWDREYRPTAATAPPEVLQANLEALIDETRWTDEEQSEYTRRARAATTRAHPHATVCALAGLTTGISLTTIAFVLTGH